MIGSARRRAALSALDVPVWRLRTGTVPNTTTEASAPPPAPASKVARENTENLDWEALQSVVSVCTRCELHKTRTQTVFGVGARDARWMVIGEAPGQEEDRRGEPFVGRAGQLLNSMLEAVGLAREEVYIANILKCRPPHNRDPRLEEVASCEGYLQQQIALVEPIILLCVGRVAAQHLLKTQAPLAKLRAQRHVYGPRQIPVVVTYHPAYLLRAPQEKRRAWQDLLFAQRVFAAALADRS